MPGNALIRGMTATYPPPGILLISAFPVPYWTAAVVGGCRPPPCRISPGGGIQRVNVRATDQVEVPAYPFGRAVPPGDFQ